jgi:WD40 repeat protein
MAIPIEDEPDDRFSEYLAAADEALAHGQVTDLQGPTVPPHLRERLLQAEACLQLLAQARPATATPETVVQFRAGAAKTPARAAGPETIGRFRIVRELGRGGCGVVMLAYDPVLKRQVALKVPLPEVLATPEFRKRFLREGQAAAQLNHPNVVPVYESGEIGPIAYIASAYCPGPTLSQWLKQHKTPVPPSAAAALVAAVADAVHHCHVRGCLHRDLKPGNIILQEDREGPHHGTIPSSGASFALARYTPKITDFGLARLELEGAELTRTGAIMGTAAYMAPEQAEGNAADLGPHTDVYALGVILFELLAGRVPFVGLSPLDTIRRVVADEPPTIYRLGRSIHRDLETICRKCLEKKPHARYGSAAELAQDLTRFVRGEPIVARPVGAAGRALRWCRRNPSWAMLQAVACLVILVVLPGWWWFHLSLAEADRRQAAAVEAIERERQARLAAEVIANTQHYYSLLHRTQQRNMQKPLGWTWAGLADIAEAARLDIPARNIVDLRSEAATLLAGVDLREKTVLADSFNAYCLAFSPDGKYLAAGQDLATAFFYAPVRIIDVATGKTHITLTYPAGLGRAANGDLAPDGAICVAFAPDGKRLAVGTRSGRVHCWDLTQTQPRTVSWRVSKERIHQVIFHPRQPGLYAVAHSDKFIKRWDPATGKELGSFQVASDFTRGIALHPGGHILACSNKDEILFLDADTLRELDNRPRVSVNDHALFTICYTPNGGSLVVQADQGMIFQLGSVRRSFADPGTGNAHRGSLRQMEFSPDGGLFFSSSESEEDRTLKIWEVASGRLLTTQVVGESGPLAFAVHPQGKLVATAANHRIVLHELANPEVQLFHAHHQHKLDGAAFSPDGSLLACTGEYVVPPRTGLKALTVWEMQSGYPQLAVGLHNDADKTSARPIATAFHPSESILAATGWSHNVWFFAGAKKLHAPLPVKEPGLLTFDRSGKKLWAILDEHTVQSWHWPSREPASPWRYRSLNTEGRDQLYCLAAGRQWLLAGARNGQTCVLRTSDGKPQTTWPGPDAPIRSLALSADETWAAVGAQNGVVRIMSIPEGRVLATCHDHTDSVDGVAIDPATQFLVTCSRENRVHIYTLSGTQPTLYATLMLPTGPVRGLSFHPNGKQFTLIAGPETAVRVWHLDKLQSRLGELGLD